MNLMLWTFRVPNVAVEKQTVSHILSVCVCVLALVIQDALRMRCGQLRCDLIWFVIPVVSL